MLVMNEVEKKCHKHFPGQSLRCRVTDSYKWVVISKECLIAKKPSLLKCLKCLYHSWNVIIFWIGPSGTSLPASLTDLCSALLICCSVSVSISSELETGIKDLRWVDLKRWSNKCRLSRKLELLVWISSYLGEEILCSLLIFTLCLIELH